MIGWWIVVSTHSPEERDHAAQEARRAAILAQWETGVWIFGIDEGEEYAQPPGWMGKVEVHADRVAACSADQVLTIDAWDQS